MLPEALKPAVEELDTAMDNFYNKELGQRQDALMKMQKTVGHMLLADKKSIGVQTDDSLL